MKYLLLLLTILITTPAFCKDSEPEYYWIDSDQRILAFVGKPHARVIKPVLFETATKQRILLFHKDSGPGVWAFYLKGLVVKDQDGFAKSVRKDGFFVVKKRLVRENRYSKKVSLKEKTKKEKPPKKEVKKRSWWW